MSEPRFLIRKTRGDFPETATVPYPWRLTDRARRGYLGQYATFEKAIRGVDAIVRREAGMPPRLDLPVDEIRAAMRADAPPTTESAESVRVLRGAVRR